ARKDRFEDALKLMTQLDRGPAEKLETSLRSSLDYERAWCLRQTGKADEAAAIYRRLTASGTSGELNLHATLDLSGIELTAKHYEEAAKLLHKVRDQLAPQGPKAPRDIQETATYRLAVCEYEFNHLQPAAARSEDLIKNFPEISVAASATFFWGEALVKAGRHERAITYLTKVVENNAKDEACGPALLRLGESHAVLQHWSQSEHAFAD